MAGARKASADIAPRSAEAASVFGESIVLGFAESASRSQKRGSLVGDNLSNQRGSQVLSPPHGQFFTFFEYLPLPRHRGIFSFNYNNLLNEVHTQRNAGSRSSKQEPFRQKRLFSLSKNCLFIVSFHSPQKKTIRGSTTKVSYYRAKAQMADAPSIVARAETVHRESC